MKNDEIRRLRSWSTIAGCHQQVVAERPKGWHAVQTFELSSPGAAMSHQSETIFRNWFTEVWNKGRSDLIASMLAPTGIIHGFDDAGTMVVGPDGFRPFYESLRGACPDITFTVEQMIASDHMAAGRWSARMTHTGNGLGMPPTGRAIEVSGMSIVRLEDGLMVEGWNEWDRLKFATALGVVAPVTA
jgi:steroid delta-isomerase-like uncharacterized protein